MSKIKKMALTQLILVAIILSLLIIGVALFINNDSSEITNPGPILLFAIIPFGIALMVVAIIQIVFTSQEKHWVGLSAGICGVLSLSILCLIGGIVLNIIILASPDVKPKQEVEQS